MDRMFASATNFNQPLDSWNTEFMFTDAESFNRSVSGWNMGKVGRMSFMFQDATAFDQPLNLHHL